MSETPPNLPSPWKRPLRAPRGALGWFMLLAASTFVILLVVTFVAFDDWPILKRLLFALVGSVLLAALGTGGVAFARWLSSWRNFRRFLFGIACVVTLIALAYAEENWRGKYVWEKHSRALLAKGEKLQLADVLPPPVPDDKNFACTPLFRGVLDFTQGPNGTVWHDTNALARLQAISAELEMPRGTNSRLPLGNLERGTFADVAGCANFYRGNTNYPQAAPEASPAETILAALNKFAPEFTELREAAATRPYSRFPIHYETDPPWSILLPHLARIRALTTLTHVHALAELEAGRPAEALDDLKLGLRFADSVRNEPFLIDHLVRLASLTVNLQTLREGLVRHAWSDVQLAEVENYLASLNLLAEHQQAMASERACSLSGLDYIRRNSSRIKVLDYLASDSGNSGSTPTWNLMPSGWYYQNMLTISRMHEQFMVPAVDAQARRVFPEVSENAGRTLEKMPTRPYTIFAKLLLPAVSRTVLKSARIQTFADAAEVACALERFRLANSQLPSSLDPLAPRFISKVPNDVIDGQPLRYRQQPGGGYLLYSVGWNKTDDGGKTVLKKPHEKEIDPTQGDWVWEMAAQKPD